MKKHVSLHMEKQNRKENKVNIVSTVSSMVAPTCVCDQIVHNIRGEGLDLRHSHSLRHGRTTSTEFITNTDHESEFSCKKKDGLLLYICCRID